MSGPRTTLSHRRVGAAAGLFAAGVVLGLAGAVVGPRVAVAPRTATPAPAESAVASADELSQAPSAEAPQPAEESAAGTGPEPLSDHAASPAVADAGPPASEADIAAAGQAAADFAASYASYRHDEPPAALLQRVRPFVTAELAAAMGDDSGAAAGRDELRQREQVATATVEAVQLQSDPGAGGWLDLLVIVRQEISWREGSETRWPTYLLRVMRADGGWRVATLLP